MNLFVQKPPLLKLSSKSFPKEMSRLSDLTVPPKGNLKFFGPLQKLNPVCISWVLRVGGRLRRGPIEFETRHPVIIPSDSHVTQLLIEQHHRNIVLCGMSLTWTSLSQTFWVIKGAATVRKVLGQCLPGKRRNANPGQQLMADLPADRVTPFYSPRSLLQELIISDHFMLSTDAFINSLRRFTCRRGKPISIWSDSGTNLSPRNRNFLVRFNLRVFFKRRYWTKYSLNVRGHFCTCR